MTVAVRPLGAGAEQSYLNELPTGRRGRHEVGPAAARVAACAGLLACRPVVTEARGVRVYPVTEPFAAVEAMRS